MQAPPLRGLRHDDVLDDILREHVLVELLVALVLGVELQKLAHGDSPVRRPLKNREDTKRGFLRRFQCKQVQQLVLEVP